MEKHYSYINNIWWIFDAHNGIRIHIMMQEMDHVIIASRYVDLSLSDKTQNRF